MAGLEVAPSQERELKFLAIVTPLLGLFVAPSQERELKLGYFFFLF